MPGSPAPRRSQSLNAQDCISPSRATYTAAMHRPLSCTAVALENRTGRVHGLVTSSWNPTTCARHLAVCLGETRQLAEDLSCGSATIGARLGRPLVFDRCPSNDRHRLGRALNWIEGAYRGPAGSSPNLDRRLVEVSRLNQLVAQVWESISRLGKEQALGSCVARVRGAGVGSDGVRNRDASPAPSTS